MKSQLSNAAYGALDYLAYPLGLLAVTPAMLRELGNDRFGVWMFASAAINIGAVIASGFGDANIRIVATQRAIGNHAKMIRAVRGTMGIHLALGAAMAIVAWLMCPIMATRLASGLPGLRVEALWSLRFASIMILVRAIESVCISTQRAFERYGAAIRVSVIARIGSLAAAVTLPLVTHSVASVLAATCIISACGVWLQLAHLRSLLHAESLLPLLERETAVALLGFGIFAWIQAVSGLVFGQLDRLLTGIAFGAAAVTAYSLCVQLCQPIYGVTAAGLHFLFPRIAAKDALGDEAGVRRTVLGGICANVLIVGAGTAGVLLFGGPLLRAWAGAGVAQISGSLLPVIAWSTAASGLGVAGAYSMFALGRVKSVTCFILAGGALMSIAMWWLSGRFGLYGLAWGRLFYGPITCLVYIPLVLLLGKQPASASRQTSAVELIEEVL
jgi:O-antigen/teichoic acid export membrane protein